MSVFISATSKYAMFAFISPILVPAIKKFPSPKFSFQILSLPPSVADVKTLKAPKRYPERPIEISVV